MCRSIAYALAAATGTRQEADRPAEWKSETEKEESEDRKREEPAAVAP